MTFKNSTETLHSDADSAEHRPDGNRDGLRDASLNNIIQLDPFDWERLRLAYSGCDAADTLSRALADLAARREVVDAIEGRSRPTDDPTRTPCSSDKPDVVAWMDSFRQLDVLTRECAFDIEVQGAGRVGECTSDFLLLARDGRCAAFQRLGTEDVVGLTSEEHLRFEANVARDDDWIRLRAGWWNLAGPYLVRFIVRGDPAYDLLASRIKHDSLAARIGFAEYMAYWMD